MKKMWLRLFSLCAVLALIAFVLLKAASVSQSAYSAMALSASRVIPSLFPLCVLAMFLLESGMAQRWQFLSPLARLFHLDDAAAPAYILGSICGYPIGAAVLSDLCHNGTISKESAERGLSFCNNASPAFLVSVAGYSMFGSVETGLLLLGVHLVSAFLTGLILARNHTASVCHPGVLEAQVAFPVAFTRAVQRASVTMVQIAGFIVLFSVMLCLMEGIMAGASEAFLILLGGFFELTNGLQALQLSAYTLQQRFILASAMLGWSGLCVHAQVLSFTLPLGLSPIPYLKGKLLQCLLSGLLAIPASLFLRYEIAASVPVHMHRSTLPVLLVWALGFTILFFYLLFFVRRSIIRKNQRE